MQRCTCSHLTSWPTLPAIPKRRRCARGQLHCGQTLAALPCRPVAGGGPDAERFSDGQQAEEQQHERVEENVDEEEKGEAFHGDVQVVAVLVHVLLEIGEALVALVEVLHEHREVLEELVEEALLDQELEAGV